MAAPATPRVPVLLEFTRVVRPVTPSVPATVAAPATPRVPVLLEFTRLVVPVTDKVEILALEIFALIEFMLIIFSVIAVETMLTNKTFAERFSI